MIKNAIIGLVVTGVLWSCNAKENKILKAKIDSLQMEVAAGQKAANMLSEVGHRLDSIKSNRAFLREGVIQGIDYTDFSNLLSNLNGYIYETQNQLQELESSLKKSQSSASGYAAMVQKLKKELEENTQQLAVLQKEAENFQKENQGLMQSLNQKDSLLVLNADVIKVQEQNLADLEAKVAEVSKTSVNTQADLYFQQGRALELAASRTHFAPHKKKETMKEALEFYKRSFSLGNEDAKNKIDALEKSLS